MPEILSVVFEIVVVVALVLANGFFVAAEFALVKVRSSQLYPMEKEGGFRVKAAIRATEHLDGVLSATQLGITLASLGLGWVGEPFVAKRIEPLLNLLGITETAAIHSISFAVAFSLITFMHIVFGELAPKSLAIQYPKKTSLTIAVPLLVFHKIFFPFIWALNGTANFFLRKLGVHPAGEGHHSFSPEELDYVLSRSRNSDPEDILVNRLMVRSLRIRDTRVQEIMLPKNEIQALWIDNSKDENLKIALQSGHSRYPVFGKDINDIKGILMTREWLWQIQALGVNTPITPLLRDAIIFKPDMRISAALEEFRQSQNHIAIVSNVAGETLGLVSFEDVLEEIVGDIRDEFDTEKKEIFEQAQDTIVVAGSLSMHELKAETGWDLDWDGDSNETVSMWVKKNCNSHLPKRGQKIKIGDYEILPLETPAGSLKRMRISRVWEEENEPLLEE